MNVKKLVIAITASVFLISSLTACSGGTGKVDESPIENKSIGLFAAEFPDGKLVDCFVFDANKAGGVSCAWGKASTAEQTSRDLRASYETLDGIQVSCVAFDGRKEGGLDCDLNTSKW